MKKIKKIVCSLTFLFPTFCFGEISFVISEIMINPDGTDSGREWIEVTNLGSARGVDGFKFKEGATSTKAVSHGIKIPEGGSPSWLVRASESFVIVSDPEKFYVDYPEYAGKIFDSSFSLTNTGGYLSILDANKNILFEINITDEMIGQEGETICLVESIWKNCLPTPGRESAESDIVSTIILGGAGENETGAEGAGSNSNPSTGQNQPVVQKTYIEIKNPDYREKIIKADGGGDRVILAGSEFLFEAKSYGLLGSPLRDPKYRWNFGDGKTETGEKALHVYHHAGEYTATLSAKTERLTHVDRFKIKVIDPDLIISEISIKDQYIKIKNDTVHDLDISFFYLQSDGGKFKIPENTFLGKGAELIFPKEYTKIEILKDSKIKLQTPNGKNIDVLEVTLTQKTEQKQIPKIEESKKSTIRPKTETKKKVATVKKTVAVAKKPEVKPAEVEEKPEPGLAQVISSQKPDTEKKEFKYFYELIFLAMMSLVISAVFFIKPKAEQTSKEDLIKKEAKEYEINER